MMKYIIYLIFLFFLISKDKKIYFMSNFMFFLSYLLLFSKMNVGMEFMMSMKFSIDYYSYILILMSLWIIGLMFMISSSVIEDLLFMMMVIILVIFFSLKNMMLFYLFFEVSLVPIFVLVVYLGYNMERLSASYFMLLYTLLISLPLLIYIMMLFSIVGSLNFMLMEMFKVELSLWSFMIIMGAFLVKMPMYLFHIWLPKAHVEAPVYGSMILAAVLLKLGSYGLLRMLIIFLNSGVKFSSMIFSVGLVGSLVVSMLCLTQIDMKSLVAYSSVVHMNLVLCCLMSLLKVGFVSSYIIMISHGLCSSGLFYMVNLFYSRSSSRLMFFNKGYVNLVSFFMMMWFMLCVSNFSFPLSMGFFGEFMLIGALIKMDYLILIYLVVVGLLSSAYSLYLFLYVFHGEISILGKFNSGSIKELMVSFMHFFPLMVLIVNMGLF